MILKIIGKFIFNLLPIFLMTIGRFDTYANMVFKKISITMINLEQFMLISFILGLLMIYIYYPIRYELLKKKINKQNEKIRIVAKELRNIFCKTLGKEVKVHKLRLNIRKFEPRPFYWKPVRYWLKFNKKYFKVIDFDFLNDSSSLEKICFQVSPIPRGLVGVAYSKKKIVYDDKLTYEERKEKYNLNNTHKTNSVISNTDFAIAKPILDNNGKVKSIITFDTDQDVEVQDSNRRETQSLMMYYSDLFSNLLTNLN